LGSNGFRLDKVYFFELITNFYIKSSPKTLKLVNISRGSQKGAKILIEATRWNFFLDQKLNLTPVRPIPAVIDPKGEVSNLYIYLFIYTKQGGFTRFRKTKSSNKLIKD
jgi:hypothetical protein